MLAATAGVEFAALLAGVAIERVVPAAAAAAGAELAALLAGVTTEPAVAPAGVTTEFDAGVAGVTMELTLPLPVAVFCWLEPGPTIMVSEPSTIVVAP